MPAGDGSQGGPEPVEYLVVATVRRPHGIRGEIFVALETDRPKAVFRSGRVLWLGDAEGRPVGGTLTVERARPQKDGMLLKLVEHGDRSAALDELRGRSLLIPAAEAAPAAAEEIHYRDLRGMEVFHAEERVGTVRGVMETPGGELLVVQRPRSSDLLIPFVKEVVRDIDRPARRIRIEPPEGLLEL
jgi:16S rRNA processing protein RimM